MQNNSQMNNNPIGQNPPSDPSNGLNTNIVSNTQNNTQMHNQPAGPEMDLNMNKGL